MATLSDPVLGVSDPDRFWTTTNVAETTPDVLSPMCWDVWSNGLETAWHRVLRSFGVVPAGRPFRLPDPDDRTTGVFYGRQAANVDVIRRAMAKLPGVDADDVERDLLGSVRAGLPKEPGPGSRLPFVVVGLPWAMLRADRLVAALCAESHTWWQRTVLATDPDRPPAGTSLRLLQAANERFADAMTLHLRNRILMGAAERAVLTLAERSGDPQAGRTVLAGFGNIAETTVADDLWRVAQGSLGLDAFLAAHGYHGPNEGNVYSRSWREQPERVEALLTAYRARPDAPRPRARERSAIEAREQAEATLLGAVGRRDRALLAFSLRRAATVTRNLELTKAAFLRAADGCRAATRSIGLDVVERGELTEPDDAFFLTIAEHETLGRGELPDPRGLVRYRRDQRQLYAKIALPSTFVGFPEPALDERRPDVRQATELTGNAGGGGVVEGRARIVLDPNTDIALLSGDILVCRFTDPSWAPIFSLAEALVIDIGTAQSHGAVVAREMAIPYVIGTGNGTAVIHEGDRLLVDGEQNLVRIMVPSPSG